MSRKKISGTVIRHSRDEFGEIIVADDGIHRSLYFGEVLQSCIRLDHQAFLVDEYNQAIVSSLLMTEEPRSILLIGLGGCCLVNFLRHAYPECAIDAVEIRKSVIEIAAELFLADQGSNFLTICHASGRDFLLGSGRGRESYDLIVVDAFDDEGPASGLLETDFLRACQRRLSEEGAFAVNLWSRPKDDFPGRYASVSEVFEGTCMKLSASEASWNTIVLGFRQIWTAEDINERRPKARAMQQRLGINFPKYLKLLYWQNFG